MSHQTQGTSTSSPADVSTKRKRGRPRKDDNVVQGENRTLMVASDNVKKNKEIMGTTNAASDNVVGQVVSGVIEGSFDAGYLLNVKVGNTDTYLRGVVFLPGRCTPITAANDVAPHTKMYRRKEIPIPSLNTQNQVHNVGAMTEKNDEQPVEHKNDSLKRLEQVQQNQLQSGNLIAAVSCENPSASAITPVSSDLALNDTSLSLGGNVSGQRNSEPGSETDKTGQQAFETSKEMKGPHIDAEASKEKEVASAIFGDIFRGSEAVNQESQVESHALCTNLKLNELVHITSGVLPTNDTDLSLGEKLFEQKPLESELEKDIPIVQGSEVLTLIPNVDVDEAKEAFNTSVPGTEVVSQEFRAEHQAFTSDFKSHALLQDGVTKPNLDQYQPSTFSEPEPMECEYSGINLFVEKQVSLRPDTLLDTQLDLAMSTMTGDDTSQMNKMPASDAATSTEMASITNLPIEVFGAEPHLPGPKLSVEETFLPRVMETQGYNSSVASSTNNVDRNVKDAITPAQS